MQLNDVNERGKLSVFLLGGLRVEFDGVERSNPSGQRPQELLAWLALHPGTHDRDSIAAALWPELPAVQSRNNLRGTLKKLADQCGNWFEAILIRDRTVIGLPVEATWTDIRALPTLVREGRLRAAEELLSADPLPFAGAPWLGDIATNHQRNKIELLERLAHRAEVNADPVSARTLTEEWIALEPVDEKPRRELIRRLLAAGERACASTAVRELWELLESLETEPSAETQAVLQQVNATKPIEDEPQDLNREVLLIQLGSADEIQALEAARSLALQMLHPPGLLALTVGAEFRGDAPALVIDWANGAAEGRTIAMPLAEAKLLLSEEERFKAHVLTAIFLPEETNAPDRDVRGLAARLQAARDQVRRAAESTVQTNRATSIVSELRRGVDIALIGPSAAGKSVSGAQAVGALTAHGWTSAWIDLSEPATSELDLLFSLLTTPKGAVDRHVIVIDDLQANPGLAAKLAILLGKVSRALPSEVLLLLVGWEPAKPLVDDRWPNATVMSCAGEQVLPEMAAGLTAGEVSPEALAEVRSVSRGDLLVARKALERHAANGTVPSLPQIADDSFDTLTDGRSLSSEATQLAYQLASLGQFEIDAARSFAEAASPAGFEELLNRRIIRPYGDFVAMGHRSHSALVRMHLAAASPVVADTQGPPARQAVNYLRNAGDQQIIATLERLDLAGSVQGNPGEQGTEFLGRAWSSIEILSSYLRRSTEADATWGDNLASAINAAQTLARFDTTAWARIAGFVRRRWTCGADGDLPEPIGPSTLEREEFDAIRERMEQEDELLAEAGDARSTPAGEIDFDQMHRTWILGQLLGFEAVAPWRERPRLEALLRAADRQIEPEGNFYPARVPWVTARVVLGLAAAGGSYKSSATVRQACDWLRRPSPDGPYMLGVWEGGTGTWNSKIETTSMCLSALSRAGVPIDDPSIVAGRSFLMSSRSAWMQAGAEVDAATALEAYVLTGGRWREVSDELMRLLAWARAKEPWSRAALSAIESQEQSSGVAQIANALVGILWATVKTELPLLFEGLALQGQDGARPTEAGA